MLTQSDVKCPYFVAETAKSISCEGFFGDAVIMTRHQTQDDKNQYMEIYCSRYPNECPLAAVVEENQ